MRPGVLENQAGGPGKRTGPFGVSTVSKNPASFRCGWPNSSSSVRTGAAGMSSERSRSSHSCVVRSAKVPASRA